MAQNEDNIFQADQCDAFDSDVDEAPTAQTMFMANLYSVELVYDEAGPSYDSDTLSEPQAQTPSAWKTTDTIDVPSSCSKQKTASQSGQPVEDVPIPDHAVPLNDLPEPENNWANAFATLYKDPEENKLLQKTYDIGSFIKWFCQQIGKSNLSKADLEGPAYKIDLVNPKGHRVIPDVSKPLPLGGPPGQQRIRSALSISKLKAANYLDFGLEVLVPSLWIESEREYDISAAHGISHWWFKRKEFYITRHVAPFDRRVVRSHMRILSVNLHPNDFEDLYLLHLQGKLNHLSGSDKVNLFNAVNMWIRNIVIRKLMEDLQLEDYTIVSKPQAKIYRDSNDQKKTMRETEVHKFSDGTLTRILEKLDTWLKTSSYSSTIRAWKKESSLRTIEGGVKSLWRSDTYTGNPVKEILLKLNLPDHSFQDCNKYEHVGPIVTSAQDGKGSQDDDQRLRLADDLQKAQDHIQR
ncbi:hypothetical protein Tco_0422156 [Tanacetum coccineum]